MIRSFRGRRIVRKLLSVAEHTADTHLTTVNTIFSRHGTVMILSRKRNVLIYIR
jgi:hypothetical protein